MLTIRLTRIGAKKQPHYRIIVTPKRYKRDGRYVAKLGHYDPLTEPATVVVDREQFDYWVKNGAQPSEVVKRIVLGIKGTKKKAPKKSANPTGAAMASTDEPASEETSPSKDQVNQETDQTEKAEPVTDPATEEA